VISFSEIYQFCKFKSTVAFNLSARLKFDHALQIVIEQNRCAMACQGCGAVFLSLNQKAVETKS